MVEFIFFQFIHFLDDFKMFNQSNLRIKLRAIVQTVLCTAFQNRVVKAKAQIAAFSLTILRPSDISGLQVQPSFYRESAD